MRYVHAGYCSCDGFGNLRSASRSNARHGRPPAVVTDPARLRPARLWRGRGAGRCSRP
ncbi:hypothetical protein GLA29479_4055 [Lysobacter antibioticus]|nr:hypothetical protein GLA29479_4055 [Lysobacter antibioticus]